MQPSGRPRTIPLPRRALILFLAFILAGFLALPAVAEYLGPKRTTSVLVTVRDPGKDVWTLEHVDPSDIYADVCLIIHTCEQHPSVERQLALCGWVADNAVSCVRAYKTEEQTITLPEATIAGALLNCNLTNGWCTTPPKLHLTAAEPLADEIILLIEGTRNDAPFACADEAVECDVVLLEGSNDFEFWALSSHGDSSQRGTLSAQVDTLPPASAFSSPPEGSVVWVSGVLDLAGSSVDASSGTGGAELSLDGGASWTPLALGAGGSWSYSWDTSLVPDGIYHVLVRASDLAGHLESTARITVHVDLTPPGVNVPDSWYIWEPLAIEFDDGGVGVATVELTIDGGAYGQREYSWTAANVPDDFIWDRHFGEIIAPTGEYPVTVKVVDLLGNHASAAGLILIPAPDGPEESASLSAPLTVPVATELPVPTTTTGPRGLIIVATPTEAVATALLTEPLSPISLSESQTTSTSEGGSGSLLWGAAALAAAGLGTAYALSRRRAQQAQVEERRREIAPATSPEGFRSRLSRLWNQAQTRVAPLRAAALAAAAAAAKAAQEIQRRQKVAYRLAQYQDRLERLGPPTTPLSEMVAWQEPSPALNSTQVIARYYLPDQGPVPLLETQPVTETPRPPTSSLEPPVPVRETATPAPRVTPSPVRVPYPPGFQPFVEPWPRITTGALIDGAGYLWKYGRTGHKISEAWPLRFVPLESGKVGVRVGGLVPSGERLVRRLDLDYPGTRYNVGTLGRVTSGNLIRGAARNAGMAIPLFTTLAANLYEFGWGSQRDKGIWSNEFAASAMVDFGAAALTGLAAAGLVGGAIVLLPAVGFAAAATAPLAAVLVVTAVAGIILGALVDRFVDVDQLKANVANGLSAWGGIARNAATIIDVAGRRAGAAVGSAVLSVRDTTVAAAERVTHGIQTAAQAVSGAAEQSWQAAEAAAGRVAAATSDAVSAVREGAAQVVGAAHETVGSTIEAARGFFQGLFGGGDQ